MKKILKSLDAEVLTAQSGNEALGLMLHHDFAVALLDVQMPEMDGFELATLMRDHRKTQHTPIVFVTALSKEDQYIFKGYETGAVDYLFKPVDPGILQSKVRVFCQLYQQRKKFEELVRELQHALDEIKTLRGIIPICAQCKKVRDDEGYWEQVEVYIGKHSEAQFSHGLCLDCMMELYPELEPKAVKECLEQSDAVRTAEKAQEKDR
jgi:CheY-like chemotaxis protein